MKSKKLSDQEAVTRHIQKLEPGLSKIVEEIRQIILSTDKEIGERIKWNNPSFYYTGEMQPFDPKEYKREIIVMNLFKGRIMLVFPSGAKVNDTSGLLQGDYKDGRRIIIFKDSKDVKSKENAMKNSDITDPLFREAVEAIDTGDINTLERLLNEHPQLVSQRLDVPKERYFQHPY